MTLWVNWFNEFKLYMRSERGFSPHTIEGYEREVSLFVELCRAKNISEPREVTEEDVIAFLAEKKDKGLAAMTLYRALFAVKLFFRFLKREEAILKNPLSLTPSPKLWQLIPDVLTGDEVEALLKAPPQDTWRGVRDRAILELLYATGIRVSELCSLGLYDVGDVSLRVMGKGNKERMVPVGRKAIAALDYYLLNHRETKSAKAHEPLFISKSGKSLDRVQVWRLIKEYAKKANIVKNIFPHTLRHSFATHLLDHGADIRIIQEMLGHASIDSTDRYTHVSTTQMIDKFKTFHPLLG